MATMIQLKILSPTKTVFNGKVAHVTFPGELGSFSVFPLHAPMISTLVKGSIVYYPSDGEPESIALDSGFVEVKDDRIVACIEQSSAPTDPKPTVTKPTDIKSTDTKPTDTKPTDTKKSDTKETNIKEKGSENA